MRRSQTKPRKINPDPIYGDIMLAKLINRCMKDGKKTTAEKQIYNAMEIVKEKTKQEPLEVFHQALDNIRPEMEVRSRRVGGAAYQVPTPVRGRRQESLSLRWIVAAARSRSNSEYHTFAEKLAAEIMEASQGEGVAIKRKQEVERMAEANKAFAHFRW